MTGLIFAQLFTLTILIAAPVLIFAYRRKESGKEKEISTLFLIKKLKKIPKIKKKIKLPPRFFLELLCLILLALAASEPQTIEKREHIVFLIDNSLSMRASTGLGSRFSEALQKARLRIEQASQADFSIYTNSPKLKINGKAKTNKTQALEILANLKTEKSADNIRSSAREILENTRFSEFQIFSDKKLGFNDSNKINNSPPLLISEQIGERKENSFIKELSSQEEIENVQFTVTLSHSGPRAATVDLILYLKDESGLLELAKQKSISLTDEQDKKVSFSLPKDLTQSKELLIKLLAKEKNRDAILDDNEVSFTRKGTASGTIYIVSEKEQLDLFNLDKISKYNFKSLKLDQLNEENLNQADALIFYKAVPLVVPEKASLYILPAVDSLFAEAIRQDTNIKITSWEKEHEISRYLKLNLLAPSAAKIFSPAPSWAKSIINTSSGSLFYAGETLGIRLAVSGLELLPYGADETPISSILLLNTLSWLENSQEAVSSDFLKLDEESNTYEIFRETVNFFSKNEKSNSKETLSPVWQILIKLVIALLILELCLRLFLREKDK